MTATGIALTFLAVGLGAVAVGGAQGLAESIAEAAPPPPRAQRTLWVAFREGRAVAWTVTRRVRR